MFKVISIGGGTEQVYGIELAKKLGFYVITVDKNKSCLGSLISDKFVPIDLKNSKDIINLAKNSNIGGIIPNPIGRYITTVADTAEALNLLGVRPKAALTTSDKAKFYKFAIKKGIRVAQQVHISDTSSISKKLFSFSFPVILKPQFGSGARGVKVVFNASDFLQVLEENEEHYADGLLIEEYIAGEVFGADIIIKKGVPEIVCLRKKILTPLPYCVEYAYYSVKRPSIKLKLNKILQKIVNALSINNSLMHIDFIVDSAGKLYVVEVSPRPSGLMISSRLVPLATGRNLFLEFFILMNQDMKCCYEYKPESFAGLFYLAFPSENKIKIPAKNDILRYKEVVDYQPPALNPSKRIIKSMSDIQNLGYLLIKAKSEKMCINVYKEIVRKFILQD